MRAPGIRIRRLIRADSRSPKPVYAGFFRLFRIPQKSSHKFSTIFFGLSKALRPFRSLQPQYRLLASNRGSPMPILKQGRTRFNVLDPGIFAVGQMSASNKWPGPMACEVRNHNNQNHFHVLGFVPSKSATARATRRGNPRGNFTHIHSSLSGPDESSGCPFGGDFPAKLNRHAIPIFKLDAQSRIFRRPVAIYCPASLGNGEGSNREKVAAMIRYSSASLAVGAVAKGS
jgi:hypothetical protein